MSVTDLRTQEAESHISTTKLIFIATAFVLSLVSFVTQTEFTSQAYQLGFQEPVILLWVTHGSWWVLWPLQIFVVALGRTFFKWRAQRSPVKLTRRGSTINTELQYQRLNPNIVEEEDINSVPIQQVNLYTYFKKAVVKQFHNVYHTAILIYETNVNGEKSTNNLAGLITRNPKLSDSSSISQCISSFIHTDAIKYIIHKSIYITVVLTVAGSTWYGAMALTFASDVTAIYNCSAFTAYAFAIPMLNETFSWLKVSSVITAIFGVFLVAYSGTDEASNEDYPYRFWGNLIILVGAILYGYYECLYKRYTCIPAHLSKIITPRRQLTFANFVMGWFGLFTSMILLVGIVICEITKVYQFNIWDYGTKTKVIWLYICGSIVSNLTFSASFLCLMALTNPVISSVSSLLTIFLIGIVEWVLFGNTLGFQQLIGDMFIVVGFLMLTFASWKEISEGKEDKDDIDAVSTYSFAISTEG
jgi:drug/metabolite transporter (DMT)-like permease